MLKQLSETCQKAVKNWDVTGPRGTTPRNLSPSEVLSLDVENISARHLPPLFSSAIPSSPFYNALVFLWESHAFRGGSAGNAYFSFFFGVLGQVLLEILIASSWEDHQHPPTYVMEMLSLRLARLQVPMLVASQGLALSSAMGSQSKLQTRWWTGLGRFKYQTIYAFEDTSHSFPTTHIGNQS